jgi:lipoprotein signal peptidase
MRLFILFLSIDLISKYLAALIKPDNSIFKLTYNTKLMMNYDGGHFLTYVLPFFLIPVMILGVLRVSPRSLPIILAGAIGNLACRFLPSGVVDFINLQVAICNLADIYLWIGFGILMVDSYKNFQVQLDMNPSAVALDEENYLMEKYNLTESEYRTFTYIADPVKRDQYLDYVIRSKQKY